MVDIQLLFQLDGQIGFLYLSAVVLVAGQHRQLDQLAGECGRALGIAAHQVVDDGAHLTLDVDAVVLKEAGVLNGNDGVDQVFRDLFDFHIDAVLGALELGDQIALAVVDERCLGLRADLFQIQVGRGVYPRLRYADDETAAGQSDEQHHKEQHAHRHKDDGDQKALFRFARLEDSVFQAH